PITAALHPRQPGESECISQAPGALAPARTQTDEAERNEFTHRGTQGRIHHAALRHIAHALPRRTTAIVPQFTFLRGEKPEHGTQEGRLSGSVSAQQKPELTAPYLEVDAGQH